MRYCRSCFGVGPGCQCFAVPHQVSDPTAALWAPPTLSYSAMVSSTETTASTSTAVVTPPSHLPPRDPAVELMDTLPPLTTEKLLATTGVGQATNHRPCRTYQQLLVSVRRDLRCLNSRHLLLEGREQCRQHLIGNRCSHLNALPPKPSTTPSASQDQGSPAGEVGGARGRSSSRGPQERWGRSRSSTRGSRKHCQADPNGSLMDKMANFMASGWRRNLTHFIGCCWSAQIGSLEQDEWCVAITKFLAVMAEKKKWQYTG